MAEPTSTPAIIEPDAPPAVIVRKPSRAPFFLSALAALLAFLSLGLALYLLDSGSAARDRLEQGFGNVRNEVQNQLRPDLRNLAQRQGEFAETTARLDERQQAIEQGLGQNAESLAQLSGMVQGGRRTWQLYEIEYLLLLANDRLQLQHDVPGAIAALEAASTRVASASDPQLTGVREKIIQELAALKAVPAPDHQAITLTLATLVGEVPQLPLVFVAPDRYTPPEAARAPVEPGATGWHRFMLALRKAFQGFFQLRREGRPVAGPLLPPDQEFFLRQNLTLKLETARLSLAQRDTQSFRNALISARQWLEEFYARDDPRVAAAIKTLASLEREELQWTLPNIAGSLELLRNLMDERGARPATAATASPPPSAAP